MGLILDFKKNERCFITVDGKEIVIEYMGYKGNNLRNKAIKLFFEADKSIKIDREKIYKLKKEGGCYDI